MSKFKVGDKVKIISDMDNSVYLNKTGEILAIPDFDPYYEVNTPCSITKSTLWLERELVKED